jgi:hypothetical protein
MPLDANLDGETRPEIAVDILDGAVPKREWEVPIRDSSPECNPSDDLDRSSPLLLFPSKDVLGAMRTVERNIAFA